MTRQCFHKCDLECYIVGERLNGNKVVAGGLLVVPRQGRGRGENVRPTLKLTIGMRKCKFFLQ